MDHNFPNIQIFQLLESYLTHHKLADELYRSCCWKIQKTRSTGKLVGFSCDHVRKDLVGLRLIELSASRGEIDTQYINSNHDKRNRENKNKEQKRFAKNNIYKKYKAVSILADNSKQIKYENNKIISFSTIKYSYLNYDIANTGNLNDHTKELFINPMDIFGGFMVPKPLKDSQQDANDCLISYINTANVLREILNLIDNYRNGKKDFIGRKMMG